MLVGKARQIKKDPNFPCLCVGVHHNSPVSTGCNTATILAADYIHIAPSVVEPELEPQGAEPFGRSRYTEVSASAPSQTKVVFLIIIHIE